MSEIHSLSRTDLWEPMRTASTTPRSFVYIKHLRCVIFVACSLNIFLPLAADSAEKPKVTREAELPQFSYPLSFSAQALLASDAPTFNDFAAHVKIDLESILRDYDIKDTGVLVRLLSHKVDLEMLFREDAEALKTCEQMRILVDRPDFKATGMFSDLSFIRARMATGQSDGGAFQAVYKKDLSALVESLPWDVVAERMKKTRVKFTRLSADYVKTQLETEIEPYVSVHHALDFSMATKLIFWRGTLLTEVPQRQIVLDILSAYIQEHDSTALLSPQADRPN